MLGQGTWKGVQRPKGLLRGAGDVVLGRGPGSRSSPPDYELLLFMSLPLQVVSRLLAMCDSLQKRPPAPRSSCFGYVACHCTAVWGLILKFCPDSDYKAAMGKSWFHGFAAYPPLGSMGIGA